MKYLFAALCLLPLLLAFNGEPVDYDRLFTAISYVESRGKADAISSHKGKVYVGIVQIGPSALADLKRLYPAKYAKVTHSDFTSPVLSKQAFVDYLSAYNPTSMEDAARMWSGGPNGPSKFSTRKYWSKVNERL